MKVEEIEIIRGDITELKVQAIVNPANSQLKMRGGLAKLIRKKGGKEIEKEAIKNAPLKVGEAVLTTAGKLPAEYVIHAPTMEKPAQNIPVENARLAMRGILNRAEENNINEIAVPGLGTGVGKISSEEAAEAMIKEIKNFEVEKIRKVVLVGYGEYLFQAFENKRTEIFKNSKKNHKK